MQQLTSKLQYFNFERGEFVDEKKRTPEEVKDLIRSYPWSEQRDKVEVSITNPSITIQNEHGEFLKLSVYHNGQFALRFFDGKQGLYKEIYSRAEDSFTHITSFFEPGPFKAERFSSENLWINDVKEQFVSKEFRYEVNGKAGRSFFLQHALGEIIFTIAMIIFLFYIRSEYPSVAFILVALLSIFIGGGTAMVILLNYYNYSKGKVLIISQGNDTFYFGNKNAPERFSKKDIDHIVKARSESRRMPWYDYILFTVHLKDGRKLQLPNVFLDESEMEMKFSDHRIVEKNKFSFIKR